MHKAFNGVNCDRKEWVRWNEVQNGETWYGSQLIGNLVHFTSYQLIKSLINGKSIRFEIR